MHVSGDQTLLHLCSEFHSNKSAQGSLSQKSGTLSEDQPSSLSLYDRTVKFQRPRRKRSRLERDKMLLTTSAQPNWFRTKEKFRFESHTVTTRSSKTVECFDYPEEIAIPTQ